MNKHVCADQYRRYAAEMEAGLDGDMHSTSQQETYREDDRNWGHDGYRQLHDSPGHHEDRRPAQRQDPSPTVFVKVGPG